MAFEDPLLPHCSALLCLVPSVTEELEHAGPGHMLPGCCEQVQTQQGTCLPASAAREALEMGSSSGDVFFLRSDHFRAVIQEHSTASAPHGPVSRHLH